MGTTKYPAGSYAVIFTSRKKENAQGYDEMSKRMLDLVAKQPGFLGVESTRGPDGFGITISYWKTLEDIKRWKANSEHLKAQKLGRESWYSEYNIRIVQILDR